MSQSCSKSFIFPLELFSSLIRPPTPHYCSGKLLLTAPFLFSPQTTLLVIGKICRPAKAFGGGKKNSKQGFLLSTVLIQWHCQVLTVLSPNNIKRTPHRGAISDCGTSIEPKHSNAIPSSIIIVNPSA